ncbi:MAG: Heavy-metal resistance [Bacteroidota bacterium]|jgi:Spy/CpxP family protein refolding chaperone
MKKLMSTIGVVALLMGTSLAQDAAQSKEMHQGKHGKHQAMLDEIPDLTEDQKAQIKQIKEESRKQMEPQRQEMKKLRAKMMEMKSSENPDQRQINQLIDEQAKLKAEMEKTRTASELKVRGLLTPDQRKVLDAKQKEKMEMREKRMSDKKALIKAQ